MSVQLASPAASVRATCPHCGHPSDLRPVARETFVRHSTYISLRRCGNDTCRGLVFYYRGRDGGEQTVPYRKTGVEGTNLPAMVRVALDEAVLCHLTGCHAAAAMMIRKTFAELCYDQGITDRTLAGRLDALGKIIVMPPALVAGLSKLLMLRDDGATIEAGVYNGADRDEVEVAIDCMKEILRAIYRYQSLVGRLDALKHYS